MSDYFKYNEFLRNVRSTHEEMHRLSVVIDQELTNHQSSKDSFNYTQLPSWQDYQLARGAYELACDRFIAYALNRGEL